MTPAEILDLLESDSQLRDFIVGFHERLALDNPTRAMGDLTEDERAMDALGRLLVGDEVCAAVAADGNTVFVSSNSTDHSHARASLLIHQFTYTSNADATRVSVTAEATIDILLDDGNKAPSIHKIFDIGEYTYDAATRKLTLISTAKPKCEITAAEHGITAYPYPIAWVLQPLPEITIPADQSPPIPRGVMHGAAAPLGRSPVPIISRLDPLFRRSVTVLSHLGLLCLMGEKKASDDLIRRAAEQVALNRTSVMQHSLTWEAAKFYKLDKAMRRYGPIPKRECAAYTVKIAQKAELEAFIETLTTDLNRLTDQLAVLRVATPLEEMLTEWKKSILSKITSGEIAIPAFISGSKHMPTDRFLDLVVTYLRELLFLEQHFCRRSTRAPDLLTHTLARIGEKERLGRSNGASLQIVDAKLSAGTHAEVRLFHHLIAEGKATTRPYFGITQLCCACCNTLFKGHDLNYTQGSVHRAGTHATHYPGWMLDPALRTDAVLKPFFGGKLFARFKSWGAATLLFQGRTRTRQDLACEIIQDLASLWYRAPQKQLDRIQRLGLRREAIACDESHYPDLGPFAAGKAEDLDVTLLKAFLNSVRDRFGLETSYVPGDGDCQFRSAARALSSLDPDTFHAMTLGPSGEGCFTFFAYDQEYVATQALRAHVVEHLRIHEDAFAPFLVPEEGIEFATVADFANYIEGTGVYGNQLSLQALAAVCNRPIITLRPGTAAEPVSVHVTPPQPGAVININEAIIMTYNGVDHYNVIPHSRHQILNKALCELVEDAYEGVVMYQVASATEPAP